MMKKFSVALSVVLVCTVCVSISTVWATTPNRVCIEDVAQTVTGSCVDCGVVNGQPRCPGSVIATNAVKTCRNTTEQGSECYSAMRPAFYWQQCVQVAGDPEVANCVDLTFYYSCVPGSVHYSSTKSSDCY